MSRSISHTTLHEAASGFRFPSWETTREFVRVCRGDEAEWRTRWESARTAPEFGSAAPVPPHGAGPVAAASSEQPAEPVGGRGTRTHESHRPSGRRALARYRYGWRRLGAAGALASLGVVVTLVALALVVVAWPDREPSGTPTVAGSASPTSAPSGVATGPLIAGDRSRFIADVTVPDGTSVRVGETFVKIWEIQNAGTVTWRNRYLVREDLPVVPGSCRTPERIVIGDTLPNERVKVSVTVTAPSAPTTCMVRWKMVDEHGRQLFPTARPVFFLVHVKAGTGSPGPA